MKQSRFWQALRLRDSRATPRSPAKTASSMPTANSRLTCRRCCAASGFRSRAGSSAPACWCPDRSMGSHRLGCSAACAHSYMRNRHTACCVKKPAGCGEFNQVVNPHQCTVIGPSQTQVGPQNHCMPIRITCAPSSWHGLSQTLQTRAARALSRGPSHLRMCVIADILRTDSKMQSGAHRKQLCAGASSKNPDRTAVTPFSTPLGP